jgi:hypothetical protein
MSKVRPATGARSLAQQPKPGTAVAAAAAPPAPVMAQGGEAGQSQAQARRSWWAAIGQLAALAAVIMGMVATAIYLSRPSSADELYRTISAARDPVGGESLANVEPQITEFLQRFSDDERAEEVRGYDRLLKLDQGDRKLQAAARRGRTTNSSLLPAEQLYLQAVSSSQTSQEAALKMFESLVALYGTPATSTDGEKDDGSASRRDRELLCVALAERRIELLRIELAKQIDEKRASLTERLEAARALSASNRGRAAAMYRAIIDLHENDDWASEFVAESRRRLEEIEHQE